MNVNHDFLKYFSVSFAPSLFFWYLAVDQNIQFKDIESEVFPAFYKCYVLHESTYLQICSLNYVFLFSFYYLEQNL